MNIEKNNNEYIFSFNNYVS